VTWGDADAVTARTRQHRHIGADQVMLHVLSQDCQPSPIEVARLLVGRVVS